jgi:hypothetical protein
MLNVYRKMLRVYTENVECVLDKVAMYLKQKKKKKLENKKEKKNMKKNQKIRRNRKEKHIKPIKEKAKKIVSLGLEISAQLNWKKIQLINVHKLI